MSGQDVEFTFSDENTEALVAILEEEGATDIRRDPRAGFPSHLRGYGGRLDRPDYVTKRRG